MRTYFLSVPWYMLLNPMIRAQVRTCVFAHAVAKSLELTDTVWWGQHHWCLVAGKVGVGAYTITPSLPHNLPHTHTHNMFDLTLPQFKRDLPINCSHNLPLKTHTHFNPHPPSHPSSWYHYSSFWNHITCVLFLSWGVNRVVVVDETEWRMWRRSGVRK